MRFLTKRVMFSIADWQPIANVDFVNAPQLNDGSVTFIQLAQQLRTRLLYSRLAFARLVLAEPAANVVLV